MNKMSSIVDDIKELNIESNLSPPSGLGTFYQVLDTLKSSEPVNKNNKEPEDDFHSHKEKDEKKESYVIDEEDNTNKSTKNKKIIGVIIKGILLTICFSILNLKFVRDMIEKMFEKPLYRTLIFALLCFVCSVFILKYSPSY